jgi:hypothetical protein
MADYLPAVLKNLSLEVKAYAQPLGMENAWSDLGEGIVQIVGNVIRVMPLPVPSLTADDCDGDEEAAVKLTQALESAADDPLLEDTIDSDTQLIGRDSCIVWNSLEQELSFCIMFAADTGYDATYAAFAYVVKQTLDGWNTDLFADLMESAPSPSAFAAVLAEQLQQSASLGFIERHVVVSSFIRGDYASVPGVIGSQDVCHMLLALHHPEIIEYLLHDDRFPIFVSANSNPPSPESSDKTKDTLSKSPASPKQDAADFVDWRIPLKLRSLPLCDKVQETMTRVMRLHALRPSKGPAEANSVVETLEAVSQRQLAELLMSLTTSEEFLRALGEGISGAASDGEEDLEAAEQHLRCLGDVLELSAKVHTRDSAAPAIVHVMRNTDALVGLAASAKLLKRHPHAALQAAFCRVLDASLVLLNHKGDETAMAAIFRDPIVNSSATAVSGRPDVLSPFLTYLVSSCAATGHIVKTTTATDDAAMTSSAFTSLAAFLPSKAAAPASSGLSATGSHGPWYIYHLLGLHDDEGTTVDRAPTAESVESRAAMQRHFVSNHVYPLLQACNQHGAIPESVSTLLENTLRLTAGDNRDRLVHLCLSSRSPLMPLLMAHGGGRNKAELCANMRLLKAILASMLALERNELRPLAHRITFANDVWGVLVERLSRDRRGNSMAHCVFNSILDLVAVQAHSPMVDPLDPIRKFIVLKYRLALPKSFVDNVDAAELAHLARECHVDDYSSPVPFVSPSRAPSPAITAAAMNSIPRKREAEEMLPPDQKHAALTTKLRAIVHGQSPSDQSDGSGGAAVREAARAEPLAAVSVNVDMSADKLAGNVKRPTTSSGAPPSANQIVEPTPPPSDPTKPRRPTAPLVARKPSRRVPLKTRTQMVG